MPLCAREQARLVDDARLRRVGDRHFDHVDAEERRVRIVLRILAGAADQLFTRADAAGAGRIEEDVALVLRVGDQRVRMRAAAGLHRRDLLRILQVGDVEDAHAAEALVADRRHHALQAAVDAAARLLDRHEQQVAPDRDVALSAGAHHRRDQLRLVGALDVVGVEAVVVADHDVAAAEREVRVRVAQLIGIRRRPRRAWRRLRLLRRARAERHVLVVEAFGLRQVRDQLHVPGGFRGFRAGPAGLQVRARIGRRRPRQVSLAAPDRAAVAAVAWLAACAAVRCAAAGCCGAAMCRRRCAANQMITDALRNDSQSRRLSSIQLLNATPRARPFNVSASAVSRIASRPLFVFASASTCVATAVSASSLAAASRSLPVRSSSTLREVVAHGLRALGGDRVGAAELIEIRLGDDRGRRPLDQRLVLRVELGRRAPGWRRRSRSATGTASAPGGRCPRRARSRRRRCCRCTSRPTSSRR